MVVNDKKFLVSLYYMPDYFENFLNYCNDIAVKDNLDVNAVIDQELKPNGRLISSEVLGHFLSWDDSKYHVAFLLRWS